MRHIGLLIGLLMLSFCAFSQERLDTIPIRQNLQVCIPDSIIRVLSANSERIDSLSKANDVLKNLLKESRREYEKKAHEIIRLSNEIDNLRNYTIKRLEASNDTLQRQLISMASNFLYIPYDEYSIEEIAIPAFLSTKGTATYMQYQNRLPILKNYKEDIVSLIDFLKQASSDLSIPLTAMRENKAKEYLSILLSLPLYLRYSQYDDWKNTYLGIQICLIEKSLYNPTENTARRLNNYKEKLELLLNNK